MTATPKREAEPISAEGWQDIASAPRDGTHIQLYGVQRPHQGVTITGQLVLSGYWDCIDEAWCSTGSDWSGPFYDPTHWSPLPSPPAKA